LLLFKFSFFYFSHQLHLLVVTGFQNFFKLCIFINSHLVVKSCLSSSVQIISQSILYFKIKIRTLTICYFMLLFEIFQVRVCIPQVLIKSPF